MGSRGTATTDADSTAESSPTLSEAHVKGLMARGLDPEIAARLGWHTARAKFNGKDGLAIPIVRNGTVVNHEYRGPRAKDEKRKQKLQDSGAPRALWNEDVLRDETISHLPVMICEGMMDGLTGVQTVDGLIRTVAVTDGARSNLEFFEEIWPLLDRVPRYILAGHRDPDGRHLNQELARRLGAARCAWIDYPQGVKDLNEVLQEHGPELTAKLIDTAKPYPIKGLYRLSDFPEINFELKETGWINLNPFLKLWTPELMVITGIPQHGKSKIAMHMLMQQCLQHGSRAAIFSAEVPIKPHVRAEMRRFHGGDDDEADAWIEQNFNFILADPRDAEEAATLKWIIDKASDAVIRYGIDWLLIDPWNQVEHDRGRDSIAEYQEKMFKQLNIFRWQFNCGVMICAHPTKGVLQKDGTIRVPTLYDIDGCYSDDTEVLTRRGWLPHAAIALGDEVACFDLSTERMLWQMPSRVVRKRHAGQMHRFKGYGFDLLVTPEHRMVVEPCWSDAGQEQTRWDRGTWQFCKAQDLPGSNFKLPRAPLALDGDEPAQIMGYPSESFLRFVGWWIAEGSVASSGLSMCQAIGDVADSMSLEMTAAGIEYSTKFTEPTRPRDKATMAKFYVGARKNRVLVDWVKKHCGVGCADKRIPSMVFDLSPRLKRVFFDAYIDGDGHRPFARRGISACTTSRQLRDDLQRLALEMGIPCGWSARDAPSHHLQSWQINFGHVDRRRVTLRTQRNRTLEKYDGYVWCLTVPTGAYIVRRNGKAMICGNSAHWYNAPDHGIVVDRPNSSGNDVRVIVKKSRFMQSGVVGEAWLKFDLQSGRYLSLATPPESK